MTRLYHGLGCRSQTGLYLCDHLTGGQDRKRHSGLRGTCTCAGLRELVALSGDVSASLAAVPCPCRPGPLEMLVEGRAHSIGSEWVFPSPGGWVLSGFDFSDLLRELAFEFLVPDGTEPKVPAHGAQNQHRIRSGVARHPFQRYCQVPHVWRQPFLSGLLKRTL